MNWDKNLEFLLDLVTRAGDEILKIYNSDNLGVEAKADESPLTLADKAANDLICAELIKEFPDIPIISEENKEVPYEIRKDYNHFWLIDPLDGTKEFIKRNGEFTVNLALIRGEEVIGGIVYTPVVNEMFYGHKGLGAFFVSAEGRVELKSNEFRLDDQNLGVVCSRSHLNDETKIFVEKLNNPNLVAKGSSLKFLMLANGNAEIYPRLAPTMEWDTAAAQIILEEAGGSVINNATQEKLKYNKENLRNPHFVAYARLRS